MSSQVRTTTGDTRAASALVNVKDTALSAVSVLLGLTLLAYVPLRMSYPILLDSGEITLTGVNAVLWLGVTLASLTAVTVGALSSIHRRRGEPLLGAGLAVVVFATVTTTCPIW